MNKSTIGNKPVLVAPKVIKQQTNAKAAEPSPLMVEDIVTLASAKSSDSEGAKASADMLLDITRDYTGLSAKEAEDDIRGKMFSSFDLASTGLKAGAITAIIAGASAPMKVGAAMIGGTLLPTVLGLGALTLLTAGVYGFIKGGQHEKALEHFKKWANFTSAQKTPPQD